MRNMMTVWGAVAILILAAFPAFGGEVAPEEGATEEPPVRVLGQVPIRPELQAFSGVRAWIVNGEEIPIADVSDRALLYHGPYILQDMVSGVLLRQEARRRGISVSDDEVRAKMQELREELGLATDAALDMYLRSEQRTRTWFAQKAADYALIERVLGDQVYVSENDVEAFYSRFQNAYRRAETVTFRAMRLSGEQAARAALEELKRGRSFEEVAKATAPPGQQALAGQLQVYEKGPRPGLAPDLETALFAAPLNQVVGPIRGPDGHYLLKVERKTDPRQFTLDEVRGVIRDQLRRQKLTQVVWPNWIRMQLSNADIDAVKAE
jgi:foldase protein PrsA